MRARTFSVEEANTLLPKLRELLGGLARARTEVTMKQIEIFSLQSERAMAPDAHTGLLRQKHQELTTFGETMKDVVEEIHGLGCVLKDLDRGLVDFPAIHEGREVFLCWSPEEPRVAYWHELDAGFAGRQPL